MDSGTVTVVVIAIFAVIAVAGFVAFRGNAEVSIRDRFRFRGSNPAPPGVNQRGLRARRGGIRGTDRTGRGTNQQDLTAQQDIVGETYAPSSSTDPKV